MEHLLIFLRDAFVFCVLIQTTLTDLAREEVSPKLLGAAALLLFIVQFVLGNDLSMPLLGGAIGAGFFLLQYALSRGRWVGLGDAWLGGMLGVLVGFPWIGLVLLLAYVSGAVAAVALLLRGSHGRKSHIPFGPFLSVSGLVVLWFGAEILHGYAWIVDWVAG